MAVEGYLALGRAHILLPSLFLGKPPPTTFRPLVVGRSDLVLVFREPDLPPEIHKLPELMHIVANAPLSSFPFKMLIYLIPDSLPELSLYGHGNHFFYFSPTVPFSLCLYEIGFQSLLRIAHL